MKTETDDEKTDLSRRSFLVRLAVVAIASATVINLSADAADAASDIDERADAKDKTLPEGKKFEAGQQVDPDDPLQHSSRSLSIIGTGSPRREPARIVLLESR